MGDESCSTIHDQLDRPRLARRVADQSRRVKAIMAGMIVLAVVLIVLVIVFTVAIVIGNPLSFDLQVFVATIPANVTGVYATGAVTMIILGLAGWLLWTGTARMRVKNRELRELRAAAGVTAHGSDSTGTSSTQQGDPTPTEPATRTPSPAATDTDVSTGSDISDTPTRSGSRTARAKAEDDRSDSVSERTEDTENRASRSTTDSDR